MDCIIIKSKYLNDCIVIECVIIPLVAGVIFLMIRSGWPIGYEEEFKYCSQNPN